MKLSTKLIKLTIVTFFSPSLSTLFDHVNIHGKIRT